MLTHSSSSFSKQSHHHVGDLSQESISPLKFNDPDGFTNLFGNAEYQATGNPDYLVGLGMGMNEASSGQNSGKGPTSTGPKASRGKTPHGTLRRSVGKTAHTLARVRQFSAHHPITKKNKYKPRKNPRKVSTHKNRDRRIKSIYYDTNKNPRPRSNANNSPPQQATTKDPPTQATKTKGPKTRKKPPTPQAPHKNPTQQQAPPKTQKKNSPPQQAPTKDPPTQATKTKAPNTQKQPPTPQAPPKNPSQQQAPPKNPPSFDACPNENCNGMIGISQTCPGCGEFNHCPNPTCRGLVGTGHSCPECHLNVHVFCGERIGEEGRGQKVMCYSCLAKKAKKTILHEGKQQATIGQTGNSGETDLPTSGNSGTNVDQVPGTKQAKNINKDPVPDNDGNKRKADTPNTPTSDKSKKQKLDEFHHKDDIPSLSRTNSSDSSDSTVIEVPCKHDLADLKDFDSSYYRPTYLDGKDSYPEVCHRCKKTFGSNNSSTSIKVTVNAPVWACHNAFVDHSSCEYALCQGCKVATETEKGKGEKGGRSRRERKQAATILPGEKVTQDGGIAAV